MSKHQALLLVWWPSHAEQQALEDSGGLPLVRFEVIGPTGQVLNQGRELLSRLPKDWPCVVLLNPAEVALLAVTPPKLSGKKLADALPFLVETQILNDPEDNFVSLWNVLPQSTNGEQLAAVVEKTRVRRVLALCKSQGLQVQSVSSEGLLPPELGQTWAWMSDDWLWLIDGQRPPIALSLSQPALLSALLLKRLAASTAGVWLRRSDYDKLKVSDKAELPGVARLLELWHSKRELRPGQLPWIKLLGQSLVPDAEIRKNGLRSNPQAAGLRALLKPTVLLLAVAVLGLNAWAFQIRQMESGIDAQIEQTFASALPNTPMVADPLLLIDQEMKTLRSGASQTRSDSFGSVLHEAGLALESAPFNSLQDIQFQPGKLRLRLGVQVDEKSRAEVLQRLKAKQMSGRWAAVDNGQGVWLELDWGIKP